MVADWTASSKDPDKDLSIYVAREEGLPDEFIKWLVDDLEKGDVGGYIALWLLHKDRVPFWAMYFIWQNSDQLSERGIYEELLIESYVSTENILDQALIWELFQDADAHPLRKHSDKPPHGFPVKLYRGVRGTDADGISWSADINVAAFFACRGLHSEAIPKIYRIEIDERDYEAYLGGETRRNEEEFIVFVDEDNPTEMHCTPEEIEAMAQIFMTEKEAREKARLASLRRSSSSRPSE